jgi:hydroxymethylbilane synthase
VTARLAIHEDVTASADKVLARLSAAGVDVELAPADPLTGLRERTLDLAVVGMQALRGASDGGPSMLAVLPREDPHDVLVAVRGDPGPLRSLPRRGRVAARGARRVAFLRAHRPDVEVVPREDDVDLEALAAAGIDAVILWHGEARRAGLGDRTGEVLDARSWPPEPGRGAVAVVGRHPIAEVTALDHLPTRTALRAELALVEALDAPTDAALGSLAQPSGRIMRLWAAMASDDGRRVVRADLTGPLDEPEQLGVAVARALEGRGADLLVAAGAAA